MVIRKNMLSFHPVIQLGKTGVARSGKNFFAKAPMKIFDSFMVPRTHI